MFKIWLIFCIISKSNAACLYLNIAAKEKSSIVICQGGKLLNGPNNVSMFSSIPRVGNLDKIFVSQLLFKRDWDNVHLQTQKYCVWFGAAT